jgi:hypothetical protein
MGRTKIEVNLNGQGRVVVTKSAFEILLSNGHLHVGLQSSDESKI